MRFTHNFNYSSHPKQLANWFVNCSACQNKCRASLSLRHFSIVYIPLSTFKWTMTTNELVYCAKILYTECVCVDSSGDVFFVICDTGSFVVTISNNCSCTRNHNFNLSAHITHYDYHLPSNEKPNRYTIAFPFALLVTVSYCLIKILVIIQCTFHRLTPRSCRQLFIEHIRQLKYLIIIS